MPTTTDPSKTAKTPEAAPAAKETKAVEVTPSTQLITLSLADIEKLIDKRTALALKDAGVALPVSGPQFHAHGEKVDEWQDLNQAEINAGFNAMMRELAATHVPIHALVAGLQAAERDHVTA